MSLQDSAFAAASSMNIDRVILGTREVDTHFWIEVVYKPVRVLER